MGHSLACSAQLVSFARSARSIAYSFALELKLSLHRLAFLLLTGVSVNDCAFNAKKEVEAVIEKLRGFQPLHATSAQTTERERKRATAL